MTTLKVTVKRPKSDGLYTVYIRVTHARKSVYINTNLSSTYKCNFLGADNKQ